MPKRTLWLLGALMATLSALAYSRSKSSDDFPDYTHLEYSKPLPPPDQQVPDKGPGSIHVMIGDKKKGPEGTPLDSLPVSLRPSGDDNTGEPSMDFLEAASSPTAAAAAPAPSSATQLTDTK